MHVAVWVGGGLDQEAGADERLRFEDGSDINAEVDGVAREFKCIACDQMTVVERVHG